MTKIPSEEKRDWITLKELAAETGIPYSTLYFAIRFKEMKAYKHQGRSGWRIKKLEAAKYLKERGI